jgi:hypothetical protein
MKYIISFVLLLSLLPFLSVDARSDDFHPTLEERKIENFEVRNQMPKLPVNNPSIQESAVRNAEQNQVIQDTRTPRDEQTPRDRQAVLCDPKFGGSPDDPGCQKIQPTPPPQGGDDGQGGGNVGGESGGESTSTTTSSSTSSSGGPVVGLSKTSGVPFPITNIFGIICLAKGLILLKKSLSK